MFSRVEIIGHLGGEPDTRFIRDGASVCSFSVATSRVWTNNDGSKGEETIWWRVSAWGRLGEVCQQYLTKGQLVFIEGQLKPDRETGSPRIWTDQNGQARASFDLRADSMKMLGRRSDGGYGGGSQQRYQNQGYQNQGNQGYQNQGNQGYRQQNQGYSQGARQAPQQRQAPPQQRQAPPQQSAGRQGPARQGPPPAQRPAAPRQQAPNPGGGGRRSTMSAPPPSEFVEDDFGPDEIPF